ncbi:M13 family metallopeptidase [Corynebacterium sp. HMSC28B08]|uniref:M13 family metallopeptidase n=1 Tax=Corynebacterium sp. HMSC28B08 TaxID=1581066 RepID=UPI0009F50410|nr:M13-type metalloendopeptidase [Corynebacterium sp. HMSC28B08]
MTETNSNSAPSAGTATTTGTTPSAGAATTTSAATIPDNISERSTGRPTPQQDLYRYINGEFLANHEIPADRPIDGAFTALRDRSEADVRALIETTAKEDPSGRVGALYSSFMDTAGIEAAGLSVLDADLDPIRSASRLEDLATALGTLDTYGVGGAVGYFIEKDSSEDKEIVYLVQTGIGLPDEAYYREDQHAETREAYQAFIVDMLNLAQEQARPGRFAEASAEEAAEAIFDFETRLAKGHWNNVDSREAEKTYNPTAISDLPTAFPFAKWLEATHVDPHSAGGKTIIVNQPSYLDHVADMAQDSTIDLDQWKLWAYWRVLTARAGVLPEAIGKRNWEFYGRTLSGATEQRDRWKRGVGLVEGSVGEEVGQKFVAEHFPPEYKEKMLELVDYLIEAYRERISGLQWMTPVTREKALAKLDKFQPKIGYPDKWRSFAGLEISPKGADLVANVRAAAEFNHDYEVSKLGKPSDKGEWFATPQTVNAFYNPVNNDITFPAAILRPPFFSPDADAAQNFGAIGAVIGHEIGHGFDDQGSKYDGDGNLNSWWTDEDREAFTALTKRLVDQFDGLVPTGLEQRGITEHKVNGRLTLGENIGDLGGLGIAVVALRRYLADQGQDFDSAPKLQMEGLDAVANTEFTALQRLFISWARVWQTAIRPQLSAQFISIDPHSPAEFRCNVTSSNVAEFYEAFDVQPGDGMWLDEKDRVSIW